MHNPTHVVLLVSTAQLLVEQMDKKSLLTTYLPGYLSVTNRDLFSLACVHIAPFGHFCNNENIAETLRVRTLKVRDQIHNSGNIPDGTTSSDVSLVYGGAVAAKQLITAWASRDGDDPYGEEAMSIMINIMAGLLPRQKTRRQRCNANKPNYNPLLHKLMDNITWPI